MKLRNGNKVVLLKDIVDKEFNYELKEGTEGVVAGVIEIQDKPESNMIVFHPEGEERLYGISMTSVRKL